MLFPTSPIMKLLTWLLLCCTALLAACGGGGGTAAPDLPVAALSDFRRAVAGHRVVEVAANDGYLLQWVKARGIPCTGVEPTASTAAAARAKGIEVVQDFFGRRLAADMAARGLAADLMAAKALQKDIESTHWVEASEREARASGAHERHLADMRRNPKLRRIVYLHD